MKHRFILLLMCMLCAAARAQAPSVPPANHYTLRFDSKHGESFSVYLDGELQNRLPQTHVIVNDVSDKTHEVVVVLRRPVDKCAVLQLRPKDRTVVVNVNYDQRLERLYLYTAAHNKADSTLALAVNQRMVAQGATRGAVAMPKSAAAQSDTVRAIREADADMLASMVARLKGQNFENDRLALAKVLVASAALTTDQIAELAQTLDFSNTRVEFLKYAYAYCADPENYYRAADVLTFSADKKKVLDYVATQK